MGAVAGRRTFFWVTLCSLSLLVTFNVMHSVTLLQSSHDVNVLELRSQLLRAIKAEEDAPTRDRSLEGPDTEKILGKLFSEKLAKDIGTVDGTARNKPNVPPFSWNSPQDRSRGFLEIVIVKNISVCRVGRACFAEDSDMIVLPLWLRPYKGSLTTCGLTNVQFVEDPRGEKGAEVYRQELLIPYGHKLSYFNWSLSTVTGILSMWESCERIILGPDRNDVSTPSASALAVMARDVNELRRWRSAMADQASSEAVVLNRPRNEVHGSISCFHSILAAVPTADEVLFSLGDLPLNTIHHRPALQPTQTSSDSPEMLNADPTTNPIESLNLQSQTTTTTNPLTTNDASRSTFHSATDFSTAKATETTIEPVTTSTLIDPATTSAIIDPAANSTLINPTTTSTLIDPATASTLIEGELRRGETVDATIDATIDDLFEVLESTEHFEKPTCRLHHVCRTSSGRLKAMPWLQEYDDVISRCGITEVRFFHRFFCPRKRDGRKRGRGGKGNISSMYPSSDGEVPIQFRIDIYFTDMEEGPKREELTPLIVYAQTRSNTLSPSKNGTRHVCSSSISTVQ